MNNAAFDEANFEIQYKVWNHSKSYSKERGFTKLSYWHECGKVPFLNTTFGDLVDKAADNFGDNVAFVVPYQNIRKTFSQFKKDVDQLAIGLIGLGLQKNDRIAIWSPNRYEWIVTQFAATKAGLILVSLNPSFKAPELEYSLKKVQCKAIVTAENFKTTNLYDILCEVMPEITNSKPGQIHSQKVKSMQHIITLANKNLPEQQEIQKVQL